MARVELSHNPYLLETKVAFNGQPPRINSLVEKYENSPLHTWIDTIPRMFYDEMNGYDFDFIFSGTALDFEQLKESFTRAGVSSRQVRFSVKSELEDAAKKYKRVVALLE